MTEWYKLCPYCDNEIKEWALKCQYCHEFLIENKEKYKSKQGKIRYKNVWLWILLIIITFIISAFWKWIKTYYLINKVDNHVKNARTYEEITEDLNNAKKSSHTSMEEKMLTEVQELIDNFYAKLQSIEWELYLGVNDYKDKDKIKQTINSRKLYTEYFNWYSDEVDALFKEYKYVEDTWDWKYSLSGMSKEIKKLSKSLSEYADKNIDFYDYLMLIQNDFYVERDWQVYFYDEWAKMDKYNQLSSNLYESTIKFLEDYNYYMNYLDEYNRYWK